MFIFAAGTPHASIWLNTTVDGQHGTFVPLSNPAVSGMRVYIITAFVPSVPTPGPPLTRLRLYAIDVREVMVERIKIIWYLDYNLSAIPTSSYGQAEYDDDDDDRLSTHTDEVARVIIHDSTVVAMVNYIVVPQCTISKCPSKKCNLDRNSSCSSLMMSVTDEGELYKLNFIRETFPPFQAVAYVSPDFTSTKCRHMNLVPPPEIWVSWVRNGSYSVISIVNIKTGKSVPKIDNFPSLGNITLTSKMTIFYNDKQRGAANCTAASSVLMPLVFGYTTSNGDAYMAAIDISSSEPELRWTLQLPGNVPALGQVTTAGIGRDTMMMVTTSRGVYFYVLFSD